MHIYFSGIGGVAIGPLAMIALDAGYTVSGSDVQFSEMVGLLRSRGVTIELAQDGSQIAQTHEKQPIDWFVYSSALPEDHPEFIFAKQQGIKISKRGEFLNSVLKEKNLRLIAVSGTHGKTTTTGMLVWLFKQLRLPVSYSIGTSIHFGPPAQYEPKSEYFIYECDEFDRNFLHFWPSFSLITSLDFDHGDTYTEQSDYDYAFNEFISQSNFSFMWQEAANQLGLKDNDKITVLSPSDPGKNLITLPGEHMRRNAWLSLKALDKILMVEPSKLAQYINSFPGTNRRFERLASNLYSDYAHHPVEITATIEMAKEINKNVVVVYQPHQNIRQHTLVNEGGYKNCFNEAKLVYWLPTYLSREYQDLPQLSPTELMNSVGDSAKTEAAEMDDSLWNNIKAHMKAGDIVVAMSAGDLDYWLREKLYSDSSN